MRAHRTWAVLIGTVVIGCATAVSLDESGSASGYPDGGFGAGPDSSMAAGGDQPVETGGYVTGYGGTPGTGGAGSGGRGNGGGQASGGSSAGGMAQGAGGSGAGGVNRGGSGGTLSSGGRVSSGGTSTGGTMSSGGAMSSGGMSSGGATSTDAGSCQAGQKLCGGVCVVPAPSNGCGETGCTKCAGPPPSGGVLACDNTAHTCDFVCLSGYTKQGSSCVSNSGNGGSAGAGGSTGQCVASVCPKCCFGESGCCASPTSCGCWTLCIPNFQCQ